MIVKQKSTFIAKFRKCDDEYYGWLGDSSDFEGVCKKIVTLLIKKPIPIDISIIFGNMSYPGMNGKTYLLLEGVFYKYFEESEVCEQYQQPKCSANWIPLSQPHISFESNPAGDTLFHVTNVQNL